MCISSLRRLVKRMFPGQKAEEPAVAAEEKKPEEKKGLLHRTVNTSRGGPNMPKRQRCPDCGKWSKRESKTMGGANYRCVNHGQFFVRAA
ncbi:MAG: hypothetical protein Q7J06_05195 [Bacteroidales bacterium]|nr:hypothetical protein [Bacteroidales bacterium]